MQTRYQYTALIACVMLIVPSTAFADSSTKSMYTERQLQTQFLTANCTDAYLDGYLNDVVTAINNQTITATLSADMTKTRTDFATLQTDVIDANSTEQIKNDIVTYHSDSKTANLDARAELKTMHSKTVNAMLKSDTSQLRVTENNCLYTAQQQRAHLKMDMYNNDVMHAQNMTKKMMSHGEDVSGITNVTNNATQQIQEFQLAVQNAQNSTQLKAALDSFCLYNGCAKPDNFHFAAATAIQVDQAKLNVLATKNSTASYQTLTSQAQMDINNAKTVLNQVGSNKYSGTQSSDVWNDIKATVDLIHQLQQIVNHKH